MRPSDEMGPASHGAEIAKASIDDEAETDEEAVRSEKVVSLAGRSAARRHESAAQRPNMRHSMPDSPTREEIAAQLAAAEARTDTKFAQLLGELRVLGAKIDNVERGTSGLRATMIVTGVAVVGVLTAILAYGQSWFGVGIGTRDVVRATVTELLQQQQGEPHKK